MVSTPQGGAPLGGGEGGGPWRCFPWIGPAPAPAAAKAVMIAVAKAIATLGFFMGLLQPWFRKADYPTYCVK